MRYIGIDYGSKKVGIALSDPAGTMGFPREVLTNDEKLSSYLLSLIKDEGVEAIVMGESKNYQGEDNPIAAPARAFGKLLSEESGLPLYFEPEVLTTEEARRMPDGTSVRGGTVDASAAALILTNYLSHDHD